MYESSTVFGKIKNMQALRGMNKAAICVKVYREKVWRDIPVTELLPGVYLASHECCWQATLAFQGRGRQAADVY